MANEKTLKAIIEVPKNSKVGALIHVEDYENFIKLIEKADNKADAIGEVERVIATHISAGVDIKNVVDSMTKPLKNAGVKVREFITQYMVENDIEKIDGDEIKSITLQKEKTTTGAVATKQIKKGNKYVDLKDVSKDELVEMLEAKGVKTRINSEEKTATKPASIRVQK